MATADDELAAEPTEDERFDAAAVQRQAVIARGRRVGGVPGAMVAGAMLAIRDLIEVPKDGQAVAEVEAPSDPHDVDRDGLSLSADDIGGDADVVSAPLPVRRPVVGARRRGRRR